MRRRQSPLNAAFRNPTVIGALAVLITILAVFLAYNANNGLPFVQSYRLTAQVPNAAALVPGRGRSAWAFNQAIMELGALICTAREARCAECPVARSCSTGKVAMRRRGRVPPPRARGARARR